MKRIKYFTLLAALLFTTSLFAGETPSAKQTIHVKTIEANLLAGIESNNRGLFISSAQKLGDFKSEKAVLPLMKVLKSSSDEASRITAALSLSKIGNAKGLFAVKRAAEFDNSERVRNMCEKFYRANLK